MSNRNEFSAGLGAKVCGAVADAGGTPEELNGFSENVTLVKQLLAVIRGTAKIVVTEAAKILRCNKSGIAIPAITRPFVVADRFQVNVGSNVKKPWKKGEVKISFIGDNFKSRFLGQTVGEREGYLVSSHVLKENAYDKTIRSELGDGHETDLPGLFSLLGQQSEGEKGVLITNGYANIFYIKDCAGVVRAVYVRWFGGGWRVSASDLDDRQWGVERQVFARNSGN